MPAYFFRSEPGAAELRRLARRESGRVCQRVLMIANRAEVATFGGPSCRAQGIAEIGMALCEVGCGGDCLADELDGLIRIAPRRGDHTEQMKGIRISRSVPQRLPVERLGAIEPSGPMMFEGGGQVRGRHRVAPPIGAITVTRHLASIPPRVSGGLQPSLPQSVSTHLPRSMRRALIANREMTG
jgi:hypothetical protein